MGVIVIERNTHHATTFPLFIILYLTFKEKDDINKS